MRYLAIFCAIFLANNSSFAKEYSLFNPTPDDKLRPMVTERPTNSDGANTIDPGRFQIETSLISNSRNKDCNQGNCTKTSTTSFADSTNIRLGLTQNSEIQIIATPYSYKRQQAANSEIDERDGFNDVTIRGKYSFLGNEGEKFGLAIIPFIKLPTNKNDLGNNDIEGGLGIPFSINFDDGFSIGGMTQFNFLKDQNSLDDYHKSYHIGYANAIYISQIFNEKYNIYAEYYSFKADVSKSWWQNSANVGIIYSVSKNMKLDAGFGYGLSNAADDLTMFLGTAYRF